MEDERTIDSFAPEQLKGGGHFVDGKIVDPVPDPTVARGGTDGTRTSGGREVVPARQVFPVSAAKKAAPAKK